MEKSLGEDYLKYIKQRVRKIDKESKNAFYQHMKVIGNATVFINYPKSLNKPTENSL